MKNNYFLKVWLLMVGILLVSFKTYGENKAIKAPIHENPSNENILGCYVEMPTLSLNGSCVSASSAPHSYGDTVEFMWAENVNGSIQPRTPWSQNTSLDYCPQSSGDYRLCARTVGCSGNNNIYESPDIHVPAPCGTIEGVFIYDQDTDTEVLGPLNNNQEIDINTLPDDYYLVATTSGQIGSVYFNVSGSSITENQLPYTFPSGAQNGNSWNANTGTFSIDISGYRQDNRQGGLCESLHLTIEITEDTEIPPPTAPNCDSGNFIWQNNIAISDNGSVSADLRFVNGGSFIVPGPYPEELSGPSTVNINEVVSWDGYLNRINVTQEFEQWRIIFLKNGVVQYTSEFTEDIPDRVLAGEWIGGLDQNINLPNGADQIVLAHIEDDQYGLGSRNSANSVTPASICLSVEKVCTLTVDAGEDIEVCQEETVELTAMTEGANECISGCDYPIIESTRCYSDNIAEIWLPNSGQDFFNTTTSSSFKILENGTATYNATVSNGTDQLIVSLLFTGKTATPPAGSPKLGCDTDDTSDFVYWTNTSGTIVSQQHGTFQVSRMGEAFQLGSGGDTQRTGFGASGWLTLTGGDGFYDRGDVNIKLGDCIPINQAASIDYFWTTTDGNIIGDPDQETITVNQSGTYQVVVKDCKDCEAIDEVTIIIDNPEAGTITADGPMVCLENDPTVISATPDGNANVPDGYTLAYVLTSGDNLVVRGLSTEPSFEVSEPGKYTIHPFVYPNSFDPLTIVTPGVTTGGEVAALLFENGGDALCASLDVDGAMVMVNDPVVIGDFVWVDENQNGLQDDGPTGINGVNATLFQNDGTEVASTVTTNNPDTNEPGYYSFEVCPNSGEYYIVFEGLPDGFVVTDQNAGDDTLDSDIDENGRTDTFEVLDQDNPTIDAGIFEPCTIVPTISDVDPICLGTEVTLTAAGGDTYQWEADGTPIDGETSATLTVTPEATTTYSVVVTDSTKFECFAEVSTTVTVNPITPDETVTATVCEGDIFAYEGGQYEAGTYEFPQVDANGCPYLITLVVDEYPATPDETVNGTVCEGNTFAYEGGQYEAGTYEFPQVDANGCPYLITLVVDEYPATPDETVNGTVCEGDTFAYEGETYAAGTYEFPQVDANGCPYLITLVVDEYPATPDETVNGTVCEGDTFAYEGGQYEAGTYEFPQVDANGCPYLITLVVDEFDPASVDAGDDITICSGDEITLTASGDGMFEWSNGESGASITVAPAQTTTYTVTATTTEGCEAQDTVTVSVDQKVTIGDFVFEDINKNGIQDDGSTGVNGVTVMLYTCSDGENTNGNLVGTTVTADSPTTGEPGYYAFEVCPNSGPYYIVFDNIPTDFEFTTANNGDDTMDSDAGPNGTTDCFEANDMDDTTQDAGIVSKSPCGISIANKILSRDPVNLYVPRASDTACYGEDLFLWVFTDINALNGSIIEDYEGYVFTYEFPNGQTFVRNGAFVANANRIFNKDLSDEDFGTYTISWSSPDGCSGTSSMVLGLAGECLDDGTRPSNVSQVSSVFPVPATSGSSLTLVINTVNGEILDNPEPGAVRLTSVMPQNKENILVTLFDASGRMVNAPRNFDIAKGRDVIEYPLGYLEAGAYMVKVDGNGWSDAKQIIIK